MNIKEYSINDNQGKIIKSFRPGFRKQAEVEFEELKKAGKDVRLYEYSINTEKGSIYRTEILMVDPK